MRPNYKTPFSRFVKKAHKPLQLAIEDAVEEVCGNPDIGEAKVGDLAGIRVYKLVQIQSTGVPDRVPSSDAGGPPSGDRCGIADYRFLPSGLARELL